MDLPGTLLVFSSPVAQTPETVSSVDNELWSYSAIKESHDCQPRVRRNSWIARIKDVLLTYPMLFSHGKLSGWHPDLVSTTWNKIKMLQWVTQLLLPEYRFQNSFMDNSERPQSGKRLIYTTSYILLIKKMVDFLDPKLVDWRPNYVGLQDTHRPPRLLRT